MAGANTKRPASQIAESILKPGGMKAHVRALADKLGQSYVEDWAKVHREETEWARRILDSAKWVGLDTETTSTNDAAELVELGMVGHRGKEHDWLVRPRMELMSTSTAVHGITLADLKNAPVIDDIHGEVQRVFDAHEVLLIYNAEFDVRILHQSCYTARLPLFRLPAVEDVMLHFGRWAGIWNPKFNDYAWHPLTRQDHWESGHRAVEDVHKMMAVVRMMARRA